MMHGQQHEDFSLLKLSQTFLMVNGFTKYRITTRHDTEYVTTPYVSPKAWIL